MCVRLTDNWEEVDMIDYKRKDLRKARLNEEEQKEESVERSIETRKKRRIIFSSLMVLGIIMVVIAGFWYLQQRRKFSGTLAPDFSLTDLDGDAFQLGDFRGKVVVIDFMATWCLACRGQMSDLQVIWEKENYRDKIVLMSIDIDPSESVETLRTFRQEFPYATWIWARDTTNVAQAYQVVFIPKIVIIDQNGYIRFEHEGVVDSSTLIQKIDQLLR